MITWKVINFLVRYDATKENFLWIKLIVFTVTTFWLSGRVFESREK